MLGWGGVCAFVLALLKVSGYFQGGSSEILVNNQTIKNLFSGAAVVMRFRYLTSIVNLVMCLGVI